MPKTASTFTLLGLFSSCYLGACAHHQKADVAQNISAGGPATFIPELCAPSLTPNYYESSKIECAHRIDEELKCAVGLSSVQFTDSSNRDVLVLENNRIFLRTGSKWDAVDIPREWQNYENGFNAMWSDPRGSSTWIVGSAVTSWDGNIFNFIWPATDRDSALRESFGNVNLFTAVDGFDASHVWAVGEKCLVGHWDGKTWGIEKIPECKNESLTAVYVENSISVYVSSGTKGVVYHFSAGKWKTEVTPAKKNHWGIESLWGDRQSKVWAAGLFGLLEKSSDDWRFIKVPQSEDSWNLGKSGVADAHSAVWIADGGYVRKYANNEWTKIPTNSPDAIFNLKISPSGEMWAAGGKCTLFRLPLKP